MPLNLYNFPKNPAAPPHLLNCLNPYRCSTPQVPTHSACHLRGLSATISSQIEDRQQLPYLIGPLRFILWGFNLQLSHGSEFQHQASSEFVLLKLIKPKAELGFNQSWKGIKIVCKIRQGAHFLKKNSSWLVKPEHKLYRSYIYGIFSC